VKTAPESGRELRAAVRANLGLCRRVVLIRLNMLVMDTIRTSAPRPFLVEVPGGLGPDLVGDRVRPVGEPGGSFGERQRGALRLGEAVGLRARPGRRTSRSGASPDRWAAARPYSTQALQPLIWLARMWTSSSVFLRHAALADLP